MPQYDFRCKQCGTEVTLFYKSYRAYDAATPECSACHSTDLSRLIRKVNVQAMSRDYASMNANEMLSVLESGNSKQVGEMFDQVGGASPQLGAQHHERAQKLLGKDQTPTAQPTSDTDQATKKSTGNRTSSS